MTRSIWKMSVLCIFLVAWWTQSAVSDENYWELRFPSEQETRDRGVPVVEQYMQLMIRDWIDRADADESERYPLISQEYLAAQEIDPKQFKLNDYAFDEYEILGVERNYVRVQGFNHLSGWSRILTFRMLVEDEKLVVEPSRVNRKDEPIPVGNFLTTWWTTSERIREGASHGEFSSPNFSRESGSELPSIIPDGMRAIAVRVDNTAGTDNIKPGTRVDVIRTVIPPDGRQEDVSRTILENIQVLAFGQVEEQNSDGQPQ